jgi:hypothetical protein
MKFACGERMAWMPFIGCSLAANQTMVPRPQPSKEEESMFVRAVWRLKRLVDLKQTLREMDVPSTRNADLLGISGPDFSKMTRGLFDREK